MLDIVIFKNMKKKNSQFFLKKSTSSINKSLYIYLR